MGPHVPQPFAPNEMRQQNEADNQRDRDDRRVDAKTSLECLPDERGGWSWAQAVELRDHQNVTDDQERKPPRPVRDTK